MSKARNLADFVSANNPLADGTIDVTDINGVTASATEINYLDGVTSAVQTQLNAKVESLADLSVTATATELNYVDGVTSNIQTQFDNISVTTGSLTKSFASGETASITLAQAISPAPVVSVTKEVAQTGISSKGAWDVATDGTNYDRHNTAYDTTLTPGISGYNLSSATDDNKTLSYGGTDNFMQKVRFSADGLKFYLTGNNLRTVYEYTMSTAWDISTASQTHALDVSGTLGSSDISMLAFKIDGTKMYVGTYVTSTVYEYDLSTAWSLSTATYNSKSFSDQTNMSTPQSMWFKPDGLSWFTSDDGTNHVKKFNLSTAWDISTSLYHSQFSLGSGTWRSVQLDSTGTKMYALNDSSAVETIFEYSLSSAWDITTASLTGDSFAYLSSLGDNVPAFHIKDDDGTKIYIMDNDQSPSRLRQYTISSAALVLGTGSFASTDVGKTIEGNGGKAILTATDGSYSVVTAFNDNSTIAAGDWSMYALTFDASSGVKLSELVGATYDLTQTVSGVIASALDVGTNNIGSIRMSPDGTKLYAANVSDSQIRQYNLSTPYDISTMSFSVSYPTSDPYGLELKPDGTSLYALSGGGNVSQINMSTPFELSTASGGGSFFANPWTGSGNYAIVFDPNGSKMYIGGINARAHKFELSTAWLVSSANNGGTSKDNLGSVSDFAFNADGSRFFVFNTNGVVTEYFLSVNYNLDVAFASTGSVADINPGNAFGGTFIEGGAKVLSSNFSENDIIAYRTQEVFQPTAQYLPAITNASGQIDTTFWTDINSMTADQTVNDGSVFYAVSTDDRTTWSVAKASDGVRPIVRDNAGTWQYNSDNVYTSTLDITGATYSGDANTFSTSSQDTQSYTVSVKPDGTKIYVASYNSDAVYQYDLSTAFDLSTASYSGISFNFSTQMSTPRDIQFKPDGTEMYLNDQSTGTIYQYTMSTAWDLSTASYSGYSFNTSITNNTYGIFFKPDGTKLYISDGGSTDQLIYEHTLTTPWRVDTASYDSKYLNARTQMSNVLTSFAINPTGTKVHAYDYGSETLYEYDLSTAWDMSTASYNTVSVSLNPSATYNGPSTFHLDYTSGYLYAMRSERLFEWSGFITSTLPYSTTATWADATTNDEFYALQQALSLGNNRMDKTQLDAVADGSHYTLGNSLDLMIALYLASNGTSPTSDGVSINYDAEALNQGAVLGTDYDYDFPNSTTVRITSNAAQNLKIRVV